MQKTEIPRGQLFKSGEDTPIVFDFVDKTLNQVSFPVEMFIIVIECVTVCTRRNNGLCTALHHRLAKISGIIRRVSDHILRFVAGHYRCGLRDIVALAPGQRAAQRVAQCIHAHMDFRTKPASAPAEGLGGLATVFFKAPAAHGWARMMVLSRIRCSISGSAAQC